MALNDSYWAKKSPILKRQQHFIHFLLLSVNESQHHVQNSQCEWIIDVDLIFFVNLSIFFYLNLRFSCRSLAMIAQVLIEFWSTIDIAIFLLSLRCLQKYSIIKTQMKIHKTFQSHAHTLAKWFQLLMTLMTTFLKIEIIFHLFKWHFKYHHHGMTKLFIYYEMKFF